MLQTSTGSFFFPRETSSYWQNNKNCVDSIFCHIYENSISLSQCIQVQRHQITLNQPNPKKKKIKLKSYAVKILIHKRTWSVNDIENLTIGQNSGPPLTSSCDAGRTGHWLECFNTDDAISGSTFPVTAMTDDTTLRTPPIFITRRRSFHIILGIIKLCHCFRSE